MNIFLGLLKIHFTSINTLKKIFFFSVIASYTHIFFFSINSCSDVVVAHFYILIFISLRGVIREICNVVVNFEVRKVLYILQKEFFCSLEMLQIFRMTPLDFISRDSSADSNKCWCSLWEFFAKIVLCAFSLHLFFFALFFSYDKNQTANRFLPASNPYNPYYTTGTLLPTTLIGPEHAATALASTSIPQSMSLATTTMSIHNAAQPQKRTDRVQVILFKLLFSFFFTIAFIRSFHKPNHVHLTILSHSIHEYTLYRLSAYATVSNLID